MLRNNWMGYGNYCRAVAGEDGLHGNGFGDGTYDKNGTGVGSGDDGDGDGQGMGLSHRWGDGCGDGHGDGSGRGYGENLSITSLIIDEDPVTMAYQAATLQTSGG